MKLKIMAEYHSSGIFGVEPESLVGMIAHDALGLSPELSAAFRNWIHWYDTWVDWADPGHSREVTAEEIGQFRAEGRILADLLQDGLGGEYDVVYHAEPDPLGL